MDLKILKIASDTTYNKLLTDFTHVSKYKNTTCGDEIEIRLNIKNDIINNIGFQTKSCIYCQASSNLISDFLHKKSKLKINLLFNKLFSIFENSKFYLPKEISRFKDLFNKKNVSRKNCVLMPLMALKKLNINE